ncbi:MAG: S9 family peptidase, partial [Acidobacteria bacterium]|nr:S9 family peptidase [Acidobacteriota bacterium]
MRRSPFVILSAVILLTGIAAAQEQPAVAESFRAQISLNSASGPRISPDGSMIAYTVTSADWENNRFDREIWVVGASGEPFQLTRTESGNSSGHRWSPDGSRLGFIADRGDDAQIYLIRPQGGEAEPLTSHDGGINSFRFSPDGSQIAFAATDPAPDGFEEREESYGDYAVEDTDFRMAHLWVTEIRDGAEPRRLTGGDFHVGTFDWSPDGQEIAFDHAPTPQVNSFRQTDVSVVEVATGTVRALVTDPGRQRGPLWSPDGDRILFSTSADASPYYGNSELAVIPAAGGASRILTAGFDENPSPLAWNGDGVFFIASQRTARQLFVLDPETGEVTLALDSPEMIAAADVSRDDSALAIQGEDRTTVAEIFRWQPGAGAPERVTDMTAQVADWGDLGAREVITWNSEDGAEIEV